MHPPVLQHSQFCLRPLQKSDAASIALYANNRRIYRYTLNIPFPYRIQHAHSWIQKVRKEYRKQNPLSVDWGIECGGEVVGAISLNKITRGHKAEIGYWLGEPYWGKGIMTRAVRLVVSFGLNELGLVRIGAEVFIGNRASCRVLEKCRFRREGVLRAVVKKDENFYDTYVYARVSSASRRSRGRAKKGRV